MFSPSGAGDRESGRGREEGGRGQSEILFQHGRVPESEEGGKRERDEDVKRASYVTAVTTYKHTHIGNFEYLSERSALEIQHTP